MTVMFYEYGNSSTVDKSDVRELPRDARDLPRQAVRLGLSGASWREAGGIPARCSATWPSVWWRGLGQGERRLGFMSSSGRSSLSGTEDIRVWRRMG